jgi:hypothetical protein
MRVALLATTIALLSASPAFAQCVYVACQGGGQGGPTYQQPVYQQPVYQAPQHYAPAPSAPPRAAPGYDEGYAAGLAARPPARRATTTHHAAPARVRTKTTSSQGTRRSGGSAGVYGTSSGAGRSTAGRTSTVGRTHVASAPARRAHATSHSPAPRTTAPRAAAPRRVVVNRAAPRSTVRYTSNSGGTYQDPIRDRAATYRPNVYGQSTSMASLMSRSSTYSSSTTTTWSGPASVVNQGGQVCGWGARIVTNAHGYAQRQAVWVCQCPQGWRPPGY